MKIILLSCMVLLVTFSSPSVASSNYLIQGFWLTKVNDGESTKRLVFSIKRDKNSKLYAYMDSPDDGWMRIPGELSLKDDKISLDMKMIGASLNGELKFGGKQIHGEFVYQGKPIKVKLRKIPNPINPPSSIYSKREINHQQDELISTFSKAIKASFLSQSEQRERFPFLNSLLIFNDGKLVEEKYFNGLSKDHQANIKSVNKSILSILVGISLEKGFLATLDEKALDLLFENEKEKMFFTSRNVGIGDITVEHLLTMRAGFEFNESVFYPAGSHPVYDQSDWVKAILSLSLKDTPGEKYNYSTPQTHLLSAILKKSVGASTLNYANKYLFHPLKIKGVSWSQSPKGVHFGGSEMYMTPRDMLMLGKLVLDKGKFAGSRIVSEDWIERSLNRMKQKIGEQSSDSYGYLWKHRVISGVDVFRAAGVGGQYIIIAPNLNLVIVTTANPGYLSGVEENSHQLLKFIEQRIIPSFKNKS